MSIGMVSDLAAEIVEQLTQGEIPSHIVLAQLSELVQDTVLKNQMSTMPAAMQRLMQVTDEYWRFSLSAEAHAEMAFAMGMLHFLSLMLQAKKDEIQVQNLLMEDSRRFYPKRKLFIKLEVTPGIRHLDLAKHMGMNPSALTQMLNRSRMESYYSTRYIGREKYYYLSQTGALLVEQFKKIEEFQQKEHIRKMEQVHLVNGSIGTDLYIHAKLNQPGLRVSRIPIVVGKSMGTNAVQGAIENNTFKVAYRLLYDKGLTPEIENQTNSFQSECYEFDEASDDVVDVKQFAYASTEVR